jgi:hypothetical protein
VIDIGVQISLKTLLIGCYFSIGVSFDLIKVEKELFCKFFLKVHGACGLSAPFGSRIMWEA